MKTLKKYTAGVLLAAALAAAANQIGGLIPNGLISGGVFALLIGMAINPLVSKFVFFSPGVKLVSKQVLQLAIVLMGITLSFSQVLAVGRYSLIVMCFTLLAAFGGGYLLGRLLGINWKLSGLLSAGTAICGGSAIAAIAPTIDAADRDVAYAISATFIFDILLVILFPLAGRYFGMSDMGFGLWAGTAVNDTSSVVAAGYAFSDAAGAYAMIVKLTRTLAIIPTVLVFSFINARANAKAHPGADKSAAKRVRLQSIFPFFILLFLGMVAIKSTGMVPPQVSAGVSTLSKFLMVMALGAIGLKTNFREMAGSGLKPMLHKCIISALVVVVALLVQVLLNQL